MRPFQNIKFAIQRVVRGYDDSIKWDFLEYLNQFIKPLKEFCTKKTINEELNLLNPKRTEVYQETLKLIKEWEEDELNSEDITKRLWQYIGENISWYWD